MQLLLGGAHVADLGLLQSDVLLQVGDPLGHLTGQVHVALGDGGAGAGSSLGSAADSLARIGGLSINLSGQSVINPLFLKFLLSELSHGDIPGDKLIFEISEADAAEGHAQTQMFMRQLQRHGCRFTLDDFGVGSSSYTSLKSMKLDHLKIDRALVREISTSMIDEALVRSIMETGSFLGIRTVAGFVEDAETLAKLEEMGVDCVQGYLIGEPKPLDTLA
jgi:EAL domain-containing protein (putative c-di-GMP-specific phosphodiesterase class I)